MAYAVSPSIRDTETRKMMQQYLDECKMETPEEVARFFTYYTFLIWDYQLYGEVYRCYDDDVIMLRGTEYTQGVHNVIRNTMEDKLGMTFRYKHIFADIFAEGDPENGYHFIQSTSYYFPKPGEDPEDFRCDSCVMPQGFSNCMCECEIRKVDGKWMMIEEWMC